MIVSCPPSCRSTSRKAFFRAGYSFLAWQDFRDSVDFDTSRMYSSYTLPPVDESKEVCITDSENMSAASYICIFGLCFRLRFFTSSEVPNHGCFVSFVPVGSFLHFPPQKYRPAGFGKDDYVPLAALPSDDAREERRMEWAPELIVKVWHI